VGEVVTGTATARRSDPRPTIVVWIDSREARLVRVESVEHAPIGVERIESDVPAHHHSTGHVRIHPPGRHGGGGAVEDRIEDARDEHLRAYVAEVAGRIDPDADVEVVGPGTVRERLARVLRAADRRHSSPRLVTTRAAPPWTDPQIVARALELAGQPLRRRRVGSLTVRSRSGD
jgi:hypothetical protein